MRQLFIRIMAVLLIACLAFDASAATYFGAVLPAKMDRIGLSEDVLNEQAIPGAVATARFLGQGNFNRAVVSAVLLQIISSVFGHHAGGSPGAIQFFDASAEKQFNMALAPLVDKDVSEWPDHLRPLYTRGIRVTSDWDEFEYQKNRERVSGEHWYFFAKAKVTLDETDSAKEEDIRKAKAIGRLLEAHGISGKLAARQRMTFRLRAGRYEAIASAGPETGALTQSIAERLNRVVASYHQKGQPLPESLTIQGMERMYTLYSSAGGIHDYLHSAMIIQADGQEAVIPVHVDHLAQAALFDRFVPRRLAIHQRAFDPETDQALRSLEELLHEITHAVSPRGVRDYESFTVVHSFVNVVEEAIQKAGEAVIFPVDYIWAVFHALNRSRQRSELSQLEDFFSIHFAQHRIRQTTIGQLRDLTSRFVDAHAAWRDAPLRDLTALLRRNGFSQPKAVRRAQAIWRSAGVRFSGTEVPSRRDEILKMNGGIFLGSSLHGLITGGLMLTLAAAVIGLGLLIRYLFRSRATWQTVLNALPFYRHRAVARGFHEYILDSFQDRGKHRLEFAALILEEATHAVLSEGAEFRLDFLKALQGVVRYFEREQRETAPESERRAHAANLRSDLRLNVWEYRVVRLALGLDWPEEDTNSPLDAAASGSIRKDTDKMRGPFHLFSREITAAA